jgi:hypothetical protein
VRTTPDVRDLVARLSRDAGALCEREILAPLLPGGRVRARLDGLVYAFRVRERFVGWGIFRPTSEREATLVAPALPWQRAAYLELLPALRVILLWPDPERARIGLWLALPYNASDARQRFGIAGTEPLPVVLADPENGADRFELVVVRVDGPTFWYDGPDPRADPLHSEWLRDAALQADLPERLRAGLADSEKQALLYVRLRALDLGDREAQLRTFLAEPRTERERRTWLRRLAERRGLEDRLRLALLRADAVLHGYVEVPDPDGAPGRLIVEWSQGGETRRYRTVVEPSADVISSGICLSGRDRDFDLTSLVSVMTGAP